MADFTWGAGGAQMTPERIAAERKIADAMAAKGMDASPIRSPWQGAANLGQALVGALKNYQADKAEQTNETANQQMIAQLLSGGGSGAPLNIQPGAATAPPQAPSPQPPGGTTVPIGQSRAADDPLAAPANPGLSNAISTVAAAAPSTLVGGNPTYAPAIASIESGGKYDALGPVTKTGDRAYGKYQVMGANIPAWTKAHLGQEMTPDQFLQNPQAQDAVFNGQFGQYAKQYGPEGAARAWFAGPGNMNNLGAKDQLGTTVGDYGSKFAKALPQVASLDPNAGVQAAAPAAPAGAPVSPGVAQVAQASPNAAGGLAGVNPMLLRAITSPYASDGVKKIAGLILQNQLGDKVTYQTTPDGDILAMDPHGRVAPKVVYQATPKPIALKEGEKLWDPKTKTFVGTGDEKKPSSVQEYEYYQKTLPPGQPVMDYATWSTAKARAGATNLTNNVDVGASQSYDKLLAEGLGKSHAALSNGVEDAQTRARDLAAMQGAIDTIQKNGGSTGGLGQAQIQDLKKTINAGANAVGITTPFNENDISDKEFLQKFNRQIAGAQAKGAVGSRVTNFELTNYLKANPGLDMSLTGNQRLVGIQSQIEQRNIAVGNQIRQATAAAISKGQKIDPVTVQKLITDYDEAHHITDPVNGQDLTQSYTLPEFQSQGANPAMAVGHEQNINGIKIKRIN